LDGVVVECGRVERRAADLAIVGWNESVERETEGLVTPVGHTEALAVGAVQWRTLVAAGVGLEEAKGMAQAVAVIAAAVVATVEEPHLLGARHVPRAGNGHGLCRELGHL